MENASKALYLAAAILAGMMIIGIMIYIFRVGGRVGEQYDEKQNQEQIELFNSKFENHNRDNNTVVDIITVMNLANSINKNYDFDIASAVSIDVVLRNVTMSISSKVGIERNHLYIGTSNSVRDSSNKVYVYDLLDTPIKDLKNTVGNRLNISSSAYVENDTLSTVKNENDRIVYRYTFKCKEIKYNDISGRVKYMKFELNRNY